MAVPGKIELDSDVSLQVCKAQEVDPEFARAVQRVCEQGSQVAVCYLLDARRPDLGETALIIALTVDNEDQNMDEITQQFQAMLRQFPTQAQRTFIMSSSSLVDAHADAEFYSRRAD